MQSKISSFFKPSPSSSSRSSDPPPVSHDGDAEMAEWLKAEHVYVNTYSRRSKASDGVLIERKGNELTKPTLTNVSSESLIPEFPLPRKILNKKRSYAQFHLELGQSDFLLSTCSTCGLKYAPGDEIDEKNHNTFHKNYTLGIQFNGWRNERVIQPPNGEGGRVILVTDTDPATQRNKVLEVVKMMEMDLGEGWIFHESCKVYVFVSSRRIAGCLVAEPIKEAFKVIACSASERSSGAKEKKRKSTSSTTLQFGNIILQREIIKRATEYRSELPDENHCGAIVCEEDAVPAICGVRAIWVTPSNRRRGIATQLLDSLRESFCMGFVIEKSQLAFSQPSSAGMALASHFTETGSFLVYKTGTLKT